MDIERGTRCQCPGCRLHATECKVQHDCFLPDGAGRSRYRKLSRCYGLLLCSGCAREMAVARKAQRKESETPKTTGDQRQYELFAATAAGGTDDV